MEFDHHHYVPCLRWKLGEYQAALRLSEYTKDSLTPLIEVPEIGFDFETQTPKNTIDDHLEPFAKRIDDKWHDRPCFVDLKLIGQAERMADGAHPVTFVFDQLRDRGCWAVPVIGFENDSQQKIAIQNVATIDEKGICFRISIEEAEVDFEEKMETLWGDSGLTAEETDLVLDLGAPNFVPVDSFAILVKAIIGEIPRLDDWRTFTIIGTSFPPSMAEIKRSPEKLPRYEWLLYRQLITALAADDMRLPTFGDYGINHPDVVELDWRLVKPAASIRYTIDDGWYVIKGPNVRDNGYGQYRDHCSGLVSAPEFAGAGFSHGDSFIAECAAGRGTTGNLTTWRQVGTSHHLHKVVSDVASLHAS